MTKGHKYVQVWGTPFSLYVSVFLTRYTLSGSGIKLLRLKHGNKRTGRPLGFE